MFNWFKRKKKTVVKAKPINVSVKTVSSTPVRGYRSSSVIIDETFIPVNPLLEPSNSLYILNNIAPAIEEEEKRYNYSAPDVSSESTPSPTPSHSDSHSPSYDHSSTNSSSYEAPSSYDSGSSYDSSSSDSGSSDCGSCSCDSGGGD